MKELIATVAYRLFDFGSKPNTATLGMPEIKQLNGSQLHQIVKASKIDKKNQPAQLYRGINVEGKSLQPGQLYKRAKANAYDVKTDVRKIGEHLHFRPSGVSANEKDSYQKKAASGVRIGMAPTVIFAPVAMALQRWYFDPRDEAKLKPFKLTDAVKAKVAHTVLSKNRSEDDVAQAYGVGAQEAKDWVTAYKQEIAEKVVKIGFSAEQVAAAYRLSATTVNACVSEYREKHGRKPMRERPTVEALATQYGATTETEIQRWRSIFQECVAEEVVKNRFSAQDVAQVYQVSEGDVEAWVAAYRARSGAR